ncbi:hypothetical protein [Nocardia araoensis]|uniref:hypothetical protein n=1 Tax=Nocardia araoensis TaxID=228600 RepID=UPI0014615573|nr:hypothetical protein [Nocardia araoensis]
MGVTFPHSVPGQRMAYRLCLPESFNIEILGASPAIDAAMESAHHPRLYTTGRPRFRWDSKFVHDFLCAGWKYAYAQHPRFDRKPQPAGQEHPRVRSINTRPIRRIASFRTGNAIVAAAPCRLGDPSDVRGNKRALLRVVPGAATVGAVSILWM